MLAALADGSSSMACLPRGEDVRATARCLADLGVRLELADGSALVESDGTLAPPVGELYAANSGTTLRLLAGILAGQSFASRLTGDDSLSARPMARIIEPLTRMGAVIASRDGRAPLDIQGGDLHGICYELSVPSAQVKSCILLAGLFAGGETTVIEPVPSRDHTERLFEAAGVRMARGNGAITVRGPQRPRPFALTVPGDLSSAAFLFAAAALTAGRVTVTGLGVNPTRAPFLKMLDAMGASVQLTNGRLELGEPLADVTVTGRIQGPVEIGESDVPGLIDEIPLLALLATQARGTSTIRGAGELRVKETDRISGVVEALDALGADIEELPDGFIVRGPTPLHGGTVHSRGDHRLAMMLAVAGCVARGETIVDGAESAAVSFPGFADVLHGLEARIDVS